MFPKILIADDSETMSKIIHTVLRPFQVNLKRARHLRETLEILRSENFDILILSSNLNGSSKSPELEKIIHHKNNIPTLLIVSSYNEEGENLFRKEDFPTILKKPFSKKELIFSIKNLGIKLHNKHQKPKKTTRENQEIEREFNSPGNVETPEIEDLFPRNSSSTNKASNMATRDLEERIIKSLCDPNNTLLKIISHMLKDEIKIHSKEAIQKHCQSELKGIIADYLRSELKILSQKKENITSL